MTIWKPTGVEMRIEDPDTWGASTMTYVGSRKRKTGPDSYLKTSRGHHGSCLARGKEQGTEVHQRWAGDLLHNPREARASGRILVGLPLTGRRA